MDLLCFHHNRDEKTFLKEEFEKYGSVFIATEDGSVGTKGNVMDAVREKGLGADVIYACGPMPMLRAVGNPLPNVPRTSIFPPFS